MKLNTKIETRKKNSVNRRISESTNAPTGQARMDRVVLHISEQNESWVNGKPGRGRQGGGGGGGGGGGERWGQGKN